MHFNIKIPSNDNTNFHLINSYFLVLLDPFFLAWVGSVSGYPDPEPRKLSNYLELYSTWDGSDFCPSNVWYLSDHFVSWYIFIIRIMLFTIYFKLFTVCSYPLIFGSVIKSQHLAVQRDFVMSDSWSEITHHCPPILCCVSVFSRIFFFSRI